MGDGKSEAISAMCDLIDNLRKDVEVLTQLVKKQHNENDPQISDASFSTLQQEIQKHANAICNLSNSMTDDDARPGTPASFTRSQIVEVFNTSSGDDVDKLCSILETENHLKPRTHSALNKSRRDITMSPEYMVEIQLSERNYASGSSSIVPLNCRPQSLGSRNPLMDIQPEVFHSSNSGSTKDERSETGMDCEKLRTEATPPYGLSCSFSPLVVPPHRNAMHCDNDLRPCYTPCSGSR